MDSNPVLLERSAAHRLATVFSILMLIFCFVYFFEFPLFPFSLDEEWAAFRKYAVVWIGQGRWVLSWSKNTSSHSRQFHLSRR